MTVEAAIQTKLNSIAHLRARNKLDEAFKSVYRVLASEKSRCSGIYDPYQQRIDTLNLRVNETYNMCLEELQRYELSQLEEHVSAAVSRVITEVAPT